MVALLPLQRDPKRTLLHEGIGHLSLAVALELDDESRGALKRVSERATRGPSGRLPEIFMNSLSPSRRRVTVCLAAAYWYSPT
jgi:hypothetical protein